ncbi:MAG: NlpC/P60 family protein [Bacillota bacterium]
MSVAAGAKVALRIASIVADTADSDGQSIKTVFKAITAALGGLMLLVAAVIAILTSPMEFVGSLGEFQNSYRYMITPAVDYAGNTGNINNKPIPLSAEEYAEYTAAITDPARKALIETGFGLLGKVGYFWGGKSSAGWNNDWGKQKIVTSPGSKSTGTYRPYGLDCSGYVDWCYKTAGIGDMLSKGGTGWQWGQSYEITADELQPGDLVFQNVGSAAENHVGLYVGTTVDGSRLYLHCAGSSGVVLNMYSGFKYFRRVSALDN